MFEEEQDNKIYNLLITNGIDKNKEYPQFLEKIYSKTDFLWKESHASSFSNLGKSFFDNIDVIIILSGLYNDNKKEIDELIEVSLKNNKPIILVRPYGLEEVPENLEKIATSLIGWNANCIVDTIKSSIDLNNDSFCEIN